MPNPEDVIRSLGENGDAMFTDRYVDVEHMPREVQAFDGPWALGDNDVGHPAPLIWPDGGQDESPLSWMLIVALVLTLAGIAFAVALLG